MQARISLLLPVFNGMPHLRSSIASILNQTFTSFKLYIIDNGSNDSTKEYISTLIDPRIEILSLPNNDLVIALQYALQKVDTEYVARMDSDDIAFPKRLEKQINFLDNNPDYGLVGSKVKYFTKDTNRFLEMKMPKLHEAIVEALLKKNAAIIHPTIMVRTELLKKFGGYKQNTFPAEDIDLYFRLKDKTRFYNLQESLLFYRISTDSIMSNFINDFYLKYDNILLKNKGSISQKQRNVVFKLNFKRIIYGKKLNRKVLICYLNKNYSKCAILVLHSFLVNPIRIFRRFFFSG